MQLKAGLLICLVNCCWLSPAQSFTVLSPRGLMTILYYLTSLEVLELAWSVSWVNCCWSSQQSHPWFWLPQDSWLWESCNSSKLTWQSQIQCCVTIDGESTSLPWCQAWSALVSSLIWGPNTSFLLLSVLVLSIWGTLSDKRIGLSFTIVPGPHQCSHYWIWVPQDSIPYFTVSESRLRQPRGPSLQEYSGTVTPPDTGFPIRCLLRLTGLWWRFSNPPPLSAIMSQYTCLSCTLTHNSMLLSQASDLSIFYLHFSTLNTPDLHAEHLTWGLSCFPVSLQVRAPNLSSTSYRSFFFLI
jgi:hypothetical protein